MLRAAKQLGIMGEYANVMREGRMNLPMIRKMLSLLCVAALLCGLLPAALAEDTAESFYGYFRDARWMRAEPRPNTPNVVNIPARSVLKLTPVNDSYAATSYDGKTGYVHMKDCVQVEYNDPTAEDAQSIEGFFGTPVRMRAQPLADTTTLDILPADVRFRVVPVTDEYAYIEYNGKSGYVYIRDFMQMEYKHGEVTPYVAFSDEPVSAYASPCYGAAALHELTPYAPVIVNGYDGDHLTVDIEGQTLYVEAGELTILGEDFTVAPFEAKTSEKAVLYEYPLENALQLADIKKNAPLTVTAFHGVYARVTDGEHEGYLHYDKLKSTNSTKAALAELQKHMERIEAQRFLNVALTMMDESNPVLLAYNENCGGSVSARFKYGCPYLFAGSNESSLLRPRYASQDSHYYSTSKLYLGGFDCIGFARWVHNQVGMKKLPAISETRNAAKPNRIDMQDLPSAQWAQRMKVGDSINLAGQGGGYHVMIYIGTLRDFGFTAEQVGEQLAPYLDNPLTIHCGMNNYHTAWYTQYLKDENLTSVTPPDGGVTISILGIPYDSVPNTETMWKGTSNVKTFYWFDLLGYNLTVINPDSEAFRWYSVYRNTEK